MKRFLMAIGAVALLNCGAAWSSVVAYTTKSSFDAAAGTTAIQTFNSFTADTFFAPTPVVLPGFTLSATSVSINNGNKIDVPPFEFPASIDGSTAVFGFVGSGITVTFTFTTPILSFGAGFDDLNTPGTTTISAAGQTLTPPMTVSGQMTFYGFVSTTPFTTVTFANNATTDGFYMDNLQFGLAPVAAVPEPEETLLIAAGFLAALSFGRRRRVR